MKFQIFKDMAILLKTAREKKGWSQKDFAALMGMKRGQGQIVSNIERGLCNLPPKHGFKVCEMLSIEPKIMIETMVDDYRRSLIEEFKASGMKELT